jgi:hypothetical protein
VINATDGIFHDLFTICLIPECSKHSLYIHEFVDLKHHLQNESGTSVLAFHSIPTLVLCCVEIDHIWEVL